MKKTIFSVLLCVFSLAQNAQQTMTIEECREMALEHNRQLRVASLEVKGAEYNRISTRGLFCPDISVKAAVAYGTLEGGLLPELGVVKNTLGQVLGPLFTNPAFAPLAAKLNAFPEQIDYKMGWMFHGGINLTQPIFMGGKIVAGYKMSKIAVDLYRENLRKTQAEVIEEADEAYANVVKAEELQQVAAQYLVLLEELERNVESAVRNGMKLENDRMKVQVKINEVKLQQLRARNGVRLATMNLCHVVGFPLNSKISVVHDYPRVEDATQIATDISARPEYAMLQYKADLAAQNVRMVRGEMMPHLALLASYGYSNGFELMDKKLFDGFSFTGGVTLNIPIYHFGERTGKLKAAKVKKEQAELELADKAEMMQLELARNANNLEESSAEVELTESALLQAENSMKISEKLFKAGTETLSAYLEAQALWQQAWQRKVEAQYQRYLNSVAYLRSAGQLVQR